MRLSRKFIEIDHSSVEILEIKIEIFYTLLPGGWRVLLLIFIFNFSYTKIKILTNNYYDIKE